MKILWFRINGVDARFSLVEFALVIGIIFKDDAELSHDLDCFEKPRLKEE